jgi:hypothetical protein
MCHKMSRAERHDSNPAIYGAYSPSTEWTVLTFFVRQRRFTARSTHPLLVRRELYTRGSAFGFRLSNSVPALHTNNGVRG